MTGVLAYLALVLIVAAIVCGHALYPPWRQR